MNTKYCPKCGSDGGDFERIGELKDITVYRASCSRCGEVWYHEVTPYKPKVIVERAVVMGRVGVGHMFPERVIIEAKGDGQTETVALISDSQATIEVPFEKIEHAFAFIRQEVKRNAEKCRNQDESSNDDRRWNDLMYADGETD